MYRYLPFLVLALVGVPLCAQSATGLPADLAERMDTIFAEHNRSGGPGCAVGVSLHGEIVFSKGYGLASIEHGIAITPRTAFGVGSITKQFTALATLLLAERGVLSPGDDVRRFLPELPDHGTPITIQDLLQHTSGLRDYGTLGTIRGRTVTGMADFADLMARQQGLNFTPGERHEYSHSDYELLGLVIERAAGEPFGAFVEREVLRPMGMADSRFHDDRAAPVMARASGHRETEDGFQVLLPAGTMIGGTGLYTTVEDLLRWERHFHAGTAGRQALVDRLLERPTLRSGETIPYAYGLRHGTYRGQPTVNRSAGGSFATEFMRFPDQGLAVATLCNVHPSHPLYLSRAVADVLLESALEPVSSAGASSTVPAPADELARYAGVYRPLEDRWNLLTLAAINGGLVEMFGDRAIPMARLSDGRYESEGIVYAFAPSATGRLQLELSIAGAVVEVLERLEDAELWRPDAATPGEYAGTYHSPDLDVSWTLVADGANLVLRRRRGVDEQLTAVEPDVFLRIFGSFDRPVYTGFHFARDAAGRVTHFTVGTPAGEDAATGLLFRRVESRD